MSILSSSLLMPTLSSSATDVKKRKLFYFEKKSHVSVSLSFEKSTNANFLFSSNDEIHVMSEMVMLSKSEPSLSFVCQARVKPKLVKINLEPELLMFKTWNLWAGACFEFLFS